MRGVRGFTLLEVMVVLAMGTILTTIGLVSIGNAVQQARFNAERARFYMDIKEQRDLANAKMYGLQVTEVAAAPFSRVSYQVMAACAPFPIPMGGIPAVVVDYPMLNHAGDRGICFMPPGTVGADSRQTVAPDVPGASPFIDFLKVGGGGSGMIELANDGRMKENWGEFLPEGAGEAGSCELDQSADCGSVP
jgi:prepilin-type N-terminal cleavage/methylation domain-containing protein